MQQGLLDIKDYFLKESNGLYRGSMSFIAGLPHETRETLLKTKDWLLENWQGQAFLINLLAIHRSELIKPSKFDLDYAKFGYEELNIEEYKNSFPLGQAIGVPDWPDDSLLRWKNKNMNCFEANEIVTEIVEAKMAADFRIHTWRIGSRYKNCKTVKDILAIKPGGREKDFYDTDNSEYIQAKLNWKPN
jgi:hypothetical protein